MFKNRRADFRVMVETRDLPRDGLDSLPFPALSRKRIGRAARCVDSLDIRPAPTCLLEAANLLTAAGWLIILDRVHIHVFHFFAVSRILSSAFC